MTARVAAGALATTLGLVACGSGAHPGFGGVGEDGGLGTVDGGGDSGPSFGEGGSDGEGMAAPDPTTCAEAASLRAYVGCDFWPTVTANAVWSIFDFAAVVANAGANPASITVTGPGGIQETASVAPGQLTTLFLPWVPALKGPDADLCGAVTATPSAFAPASAYHLVSSAPVTVYQFNALEYLGQGGPPNKDWSSCPGNLRSCTSTKPEDCYSFTNDASLLLPSTAMTGNYRVTGHGGWGLAQIGAFATITATVDHTTVHVKVSASGLVTAGDGIAVTKAGETLTLQMNAGDVAQLVGDTGDASDLSGSLVTASQPVQLITGVPCLQVPDASSACDHVEEVNFPAETLGSDYVVAQPTGPHGVTVGQDVRIYGSFDGTTLTYLPAAPPGCPTTIQAGQNADCGIVTADFEIQANQPFGVSVFTQGASVVDATDVPPTQEGDPDQSLPTAVAQYRTRYVFLAPPDYEENYAVVIAPGGSAVTLDGTLVSDTPWPIAATGYGVLRLPLATGQAGAHVLTASQPVGLQVMGYGSYTSYQYPGGLDFRLIAPPPTK